MGKGNSPYYKTGWDRGVSVPGAFKLDHLQPNEPLLLWKIFNFFTFILGGQFLLPQRANYGKREFFQLQNWMRQRGLGAWGIQTGPFAALCTSHILKLFHLFHLHTGEANSYYPRRPIIRNGNSSNFKTEWDRGFSVPGAFKLDHLQPIKPLLFQYFFTFSTFILGDHFLLPQKANYQKWEFFKLQNRMRQGVFSAWGIQTGPRSQDIGYLSFSPSEKSDKFTTSLAWLRHAARVNQTGIEAQPT